MTVFSPPAFLGASVTPTPTYLQHTARLMRLALNATFHRSSAGALGAQSGAMFGAAGQMGECALTSPTNLSINPAIFVIQGSKAGNQGQYVAPNDALVNLAVPAQDASLYRRAYVGVTVYDSLEAGVASSATTDQALPQIISGTLQASATPTYPTVPDNTLLLGELLIPPTGQTVTLTPYNPRAGVAGGLNPVVADTSTTAGHGGVAGMYPGDYRDVAPASGVAALGAGGPQRWNGTAWQAVSPLDFPVCVVRQAVAQTALASGWQVLALDTVDIDTHNAYSAAAVSGTGQRGFVVPAGQGGIYAVQGLFQLAHGNAFTDCRILKNGAAPPASHGEGVNTADTTGVNTGRHIFNMAAGDTFVMQGFYNSGAGTWATLVASDAGSWMSVERIR